MRINLIMGKCLLWLLSNLQTKIIKKLLVIFRCLGQEFKKARGAFGLYGIRNLYFSIHLATPDFYINISLYIPILKNSWNTIKQTGKDKCSHSCMLSLNKILKYEYFIYARSGLWSYPHKISQILLRQSYDYG